MRTTRRQCFLQAEAAGELFQTAVRPGHQPPIDPIREEIVNVAGVADRPATQPAGLDSGGENMRLEVSQPVLTNEDLERIRNIEDSCTGFRTKTLGITHR